MSSGFRTAFPSRFATVMAAVVLILSTGQTAPWAAAPQIPQDVSGRAGRAGRVRVIAELRLGASDVPEGNLRTSGAVLAQRQRIAARASQLLSRLSPGSHRTIRRFATVPFIVLDVTAAALDELARDADVVRVMDDAILFPVLGYSVPIVEGDQVWASGYDGTGTTIAVLDTGVDATHPFLAGKVVEQACYSSIVPGISETFCPNGSETQTGAGRGGAVPSDRLSSRHACRGHRGRRRHRSRRAISGRRQRRQPDGRSGVHQGHRRGKLRWSRTLRRRLQLRRHRRSGAGVHGRSLRISQHRRGEHEPGWKHLPGSMRRRALQADHRQSAGDWHRHGGLGR